MYRDTDDSDCFPNQSSIKQLRHLKWVIIADSMNFLRRRLRFCFFFVFDKILVVIFLTSSAYQGLNYLPDIFTLHSLIFRDRRLELGN